MNASILEAWEGAEVVWAVRYANAVEKAGASSVGFNVVLAPGVDAPHLSVYAGPGARASTARWAYTSLLN